MRRVEFSNKIKAEIVERAKNADGLICCEGCDLVLGKKLHHIDHTLPEGLRLDKSRPLTAADGKLLGWDCCHKPKTAEDVRQIRKADRQRYRHAGIKSSRRPMDGSRGSRFRKRMDGTVEMRR